MCEASTPEVKRSFRASAWLAQIRALTREDLPLFMHHLLRLEDPCRRLRFGGIATDTFIRDYAMRVDFDNTAVLGCFVDAELVGAAELRSLDAQWSRAAEAAFSVERAWRSRGIGTALMAGLIRQAADLRVARLFMSCHAFNRPIQRIADRFAAKLSFEGSDCTADIAVRAENYEPYFAHPDGGIVVVDLGARQGAWQGR